MLGRRCFRRADWAVAAAAFLWAFVSITAWAGESPSAPAADPAPKTADPAPKTADPAPKTADPAPKAADPAPKEVLLRFHFRFQPWNEVLDWFARKADLSLVMDSCPQGTFNYTDNREYTTAEAIDLLNGILLTKGYTLVRRGRMLMVINLEDGIPANLVSTVSLDELSQKGEFELVRVLFNLDQLRPEEAQAEIMKLLGPQGSVVPLVKSRQVLVTDTAGRLRVVRSVLERIEGSVAGAGLAGSPQLEVYPIVGTDPQSVLPVMQTLLGNQSDVRMTVDAKSSSLIVMARPAQQATVRATLAQLQREGQRIEVIRLARVDPQTAVLSINKLFGAADPALGSAAGPQIDADPVTRNLMIRGTEAQIAQIRGLLEQLGENLSPTGVSGTSRVRSLPMSGGSVSAALERIQEIWPTLRGNPIRVVGSPGALSGQGSETGPRNEPLPAAPPRPRRPKPRIEIDQPADAPQAKGPSHSDAPAVPAPVKPATDERSAVLFGGARVLFASEETEWKEQPETAEAETPKQEPSVVASPARSPIVVMPGPNGLTIASDDLEALDEFERLLNTVTDGLTGGREVAVLYLKHAKASDVALRLNEIVGTGPAVAAAPARSNRGPAPAVSGGILGTLSTGRSALATGPVSIASDARLNALFVQANPTDLDTIKQLLEVLDQKESPEEISLSPKPRMIPVHHVPVYEIADIVREVYVDRMVEGSSARPQMGPGGMMAAMMMQRMGGMGDPGGQGGRNRQQPRGNQNQTDNVVRLSLGVDARSNSLIVSAPDSLFEEVKLLVEQLDTAASDQEQTVRVVTVRNAGVAAVGRAIEAIGGETVQVNTGSLLEQPAVPFTPSWMSNRPGQQTRPYSQAQTGAYRPQQSGAYRPQQSAQQSGAYRPQQGGANRQQQGGYRPQQGGVNRQQQGGARQPQGGMQGRNTGRTGR